MVTCDDASWMQFLAPDDKVCDTPPDGVVKTLPVAEEDVVLKTSIINASIRVYRPKTKEPLKLDPDALLQLPGARPSKFQNCLCKIPLPRATIKFFGTGTIAICTQDEGVLTDLMLRINLLKLVCISHPMFPEHAMRIDKAFRISLRKCEAPRIMNIVGMPLQNICAVLQRCKDPRIASVAIGKKGGVFVRIRLSGKQSFKGKRKHHLASRRKSKSLAAADEDALLVTVHRAGNTWVSGKCSKERMVQAYLLVCAALAGASKMSRF